MHRKRMIMTTKGQCHATVVLLCLGRGGDPNSYRPKRDESQWWSRRDALVRCVASFLFGPSPPYSTEQVAAIRKEMIMIFDDDWAKLHLSLDGSTGATRDSIPTEQTILSVFKQAAQSPNVEISRDGLKCRVVLDPTLVLSKGSNGKGKLPSELPTGLDSKRQVLEYLQKHCSIDFLRTNGLNSNPTVILRKTNKKALMEVWSKWRRQVTQDKSNDSSLAGNTSSPSNNQKQIEALYSEIIRQSMEKKTGTNDDTTIVGTLHETCEEFPCFGGMKDMLADESLRIVMFLGAVRDMTDQENRILEQVCKELHVPHVGIRFGSVPEFTSKILSILAFHHSHQSALKGATRRLLAAKSAKSTTAAGKAPPRQATCLHVICTVPLKSREISVDLVQRDRIHWCIVRVVVCTLWRSRLASSDASSKVAHVNTLTFLFDDGVVLNLAEETFVAKLASQHQAAPSEYQILAAIRTLLDSQSPPQGEWSKKALAAQVIDRIVEASPQSVESTISISPDGGNQVSELFFTAGTLQDDDGTPRSNNAVMAVLDIRKESFIAAKSTSKPQKTCKLHRAILAASEKKKIPTFHQSIISNAGEDYEAASVTCLQHLLYQNRLFAIQSAIISGKKRKSSIL